MKTSETPAAGVGDGSLPPGQRLNTSPPSRSPARALVLPGALALALVLFAFAVRLHSNLFLSFLGAGGGLLLWTAALALAARRTARRFGLEVAVHRHHWVQACAQIAVLLYLGWHVRFVYAFLPLIVAQLVFAYGVDSLLTWSRRDTYRLGFGPFPVVLSINLFLWFRPEWFHLQFLMILVGYAAKEFIRWDRDGRSAHIFNPSSFPLAAFALALILTGTTDITLGRELASAYSVPPHIYLVIFLAALPGQLLFGVARMTMPAVVTMYGISLLYFRATGTYLFYDAHIPPPVFLGMHLLLTDPSTSPRAESGRIAFGVLYGVGTTALFVILTAVGAPTFFDKLLPLPIMNLMVRRIDRLAISRPFASLDPARLARAAGPMQRSFAYVLLWAVIFAGMSMVQGVGDRHPGQYLPFWEGACQEGSTRACEYAVARKSVYCVKGSGWACNEWGIELAGLQRVRAFRRGCDLGFAPACENAARTAADQQPLAAGAPPPQDLPILLSGTKATIRDRSPAELYALACAQGWADVCRGRALQTEP